MSIYKSVAKIGPKFFSPSTLFKYGFNFSPMYRRSTGRIVEVSEDLTHVKVKLRISWKNRNYMNTIFGGSMFAAVDPIPMIQLVHIIGNDYVVWDKTAEVAFKRPAKVDLYANFTFSDAELETIKEGVATKKEIVIEKTTELTNKEGTQVYCLVKKTIYVADKAFYKEKRKKSAAAKQA